MRTMNKENVRKLLIKMLSPNMRKLLQYTAATQFFISSSIDILKQDESFVGLIGNLRTQSRALN